MIKKMKPPRILWAMGPAGEVTDHTLDEFARFASPGDVLVDGGNSYFRDSMRRAAKYSGMGFRFLDVGVSGGIWGLENGYCMMVGGPADGVAIAKPALDTLAPPNGWSHFGKNGAGHFVKMVHNGIEYGMMQAYGEGFELLHASEFELDLRKVSTVWLQGSVVRSWLLELAERAFEQEGSDLKNIKGWVEDSGEGRWTVLEAVTHGVPMTAIAHSLFARFVSRPDESAERGGLAQLRGAPAFRGDRRRRRLRRSAAHTRPARLRPRHARESALLPGDPALRLRADRESDRGPSAAGRDRVGAHRRR